MTTPVMQTVLTLRLIYFSLL